jgi:hypothetical protein
MIGGAAGRRLKASKGGNRAEGTLGWCRGRYRDLSAADLPLISQRPCAAFSDQLERVAEHAV